MPDSLQLTYNVVVATEIRNSSFTIQEVFDYDTMGLRRGLLLLDGCTFSSILVKFH